MLTRVLMLLVLTSGSLLSCAGQRVQDPEPVTGDYDCDERPDQAFLGRAAGKVYVGVIIGRLSEPQVLEFAVDAGVQAAVCSEDVTLETESLDYDPTEMVGELEGFAPSTTCSGLIVAVEDCDSIHMYWNHVATHID